MPTYADVTDTMNKMGLDTAAHRLGRIVVALGRGDGVPTGTVRGLATHLKVPPSAVTRGTDKLVRCGLVTRVEDPADKRSVLIALTHQGKKLAAQMVA